MQRTTMIFLAIAASLLGAGCDPIDKTPEETCEMLIDCGYNMTQNGCLAEIGSRELSSSCLDAMFATTCEDHLSSYPSYVDTCYDTCTVEGRVCDEDDIRICSGGYEVVYDCYKVCRYAEENPGSYSGSCGTVSPNGDVSDDGGDVCWCWE